MHRLVPFSYLHLILIFPAVCDLFRPATSRSDILIAKHYTEVNPNIDRSNKNLAHSYWHSHQHLAVIFNYFSSQSMSCLPYAWRPRERERASQRSGDGARSGMNSHRSSGNCLSLSLSVTIRFTASCFSQIQWCLSEERVRREIECEVKAGLRDSFLWHLVGRGFGDVTCSGTSLKWRGHAEQITPPALVTAVPSVSSLKRVWPRQLPSDVFLNDLTVNQSFHGGKGDLNSFYWMLICLAGAVVYSSSATIKHNSPVQCYHWV